MIALSLRRLCYLAERAGRSTENSLYFSEICFFNFLIDLQKKFCARHTGPSTVQVNCLFEATFYRVSHNPCPSPCKYELQLLIGHGLIGFPVRYDLY